YTGSGGGDRVVNPRWRGWSPGSLSGLGPIQPSWASTALRLWPPRWCLLAGHFRLAAEDEAQARQPRLGLVPFRDIQGEYRVTQATEQAGRPRARRAIDPEPERLRIAREVAARAALRIAFREGSSQLLQALLEALPVGEQVIHLQAIDLRQGDLLEP